MRLTIIICCFVFSVSSLFAQSAKVVGYFPSYQFDHLESIDFCKLTHLNLSFANPDADGDLIMNDVTAVVQHARLENPDITIFIALAGGALSAVQAANWSNLIDNPANRPGFIAKILDYVETNDLDGVDMDLEWSHVTAGYTAFAIELGAALKSKNLGISAALPATYRYPEVTNEVINMYEWINLMAYDLTGSWDPDNEGPHSPYFFARAGIDYWKAFDIPGDKLTLGVPFYGVEFGNGGVSAFTYRYMVNMDTTNAYLDQVGNAYYNGIPTIKDKVTLANEEVSGIMIWELGQDHFSQFSLLNAIDEQYKSLGVTTSTAANCGIVNSDDPNSFLEVEVFPNPVSNELLIAATKTPIKSISLFDLHGRLLDQHVDIIQTQYSLDMLSLPPNIYVLSIQIGDHYVTKRIIKY